MIAKTVDDRLAMLQTGGCCTACWLCFPLDARLTAMDAETNRGRRGAATEKKNTDGIRREPPLLALTARRLQGCIEPPSSRSKKKRLPLSPLPPRG